MKFNKGDKVKIARILDEESLLLNKEDVINKTGKIVMVYLENDDEYPYGVRFDNPPDGLEEDIFFMEGELELA